MYLSSLVVLERLFRWWHNQRKTSYTFELTSEIVIFQEISYLVVTPEKVAVPRKPRVQAKFVYGNGHEFLTVVKLNSAKSMEEPRPVS